MSEENTYKPRHGNFSQWEESEHDAEAAFASLVNDALDEQIAEGRRQAEQDARDAVAALDYTEDDAAALAASQARTTLLDGQARPSASEARTTLLDGRAQADQAGEARTTLMAGRREAAPAPAPARAQRPDTTLVDENAPVAEVYQPAPTIRRDPIAPARPAVPSEPYDSEYVPVEAPRRGRAGRPAARRGADQHPVLGTLVGLLAIVPRLAAIAYCLLVVVSAVPNLSSRLMVIRMASVADAIIPQSLAGLLVYQTPFGGAFRGDYAIAALALFIIDWAIVKVAYAIKGGRDA